MKGLLAIETRLPAFAAGEIIQWTVPPPEAPPDIGRVNRLDRWGMREFSRPLDTASDVTQYAALALPGLALIGAEGEECLAIAVMYVESMLLVQGIKNMIKGLTRRYRPYMYQDPVPEEAAAERDRYLSFPSGHSAASFAAATFSAFVYGALYPDSVWRLPLAVTAYALAGATAALRVLAGQHFITDVAAGALLGVMTGLLVPWLHALPGPDGAAGAWVVSRPALAAGFPLPGRCVVLRLRY